MKNKKVLLAAIALLVVAGVMSAVYFATRPTVQDWTGSKTITVTVVHSDGKSEDFVFNTDEDYLGEVLQEAGLISGTPGEFGLYIETVDGETASWEENGAYWAFYVGEEYATTSVDLTPITDGAVYKLVYTLG